MEVETFALEDECADAILDVVSEHIMDCELRWKHGGETYLASRGFLNGLQGHVYLHGRRMLDKTCLDV